MVKIRLMRVGKRKQPTYRVVVADARSPRDGRIIEAIGHYDPRSEPSSVLIDSARADYWLARGAQPTGSVRKLLDIAAGAAQAPGPPPDVRARATPAGSVEATAPTGDETGEPETAEETGETASEETPAPDDASDEASEENA